MKINQRDAGHMTKMAAMSIYGKHTLKTIFPETSRLISTKIGTKQRRFRPIIFCSNDKSELTLTYLRQGQILQLML